MVKQTHKLIYKKALKTRLTQKQPIKHPRDGKTEMKSLEGVFFLRNRRLGGR